MRIQAGWNFRKGHVSAVKFPDLRENTGNFVGIRPSGDAGSQPNARNSGEIPYKANREIFEANREGPLEKQGLPSPRQRMWRTFQMAARPDVPE
jgi:hypothetical protein